MPYTEVDFLITPCEPWRDLLMVELMELDYEGFEETAFGLKAYVENTKFNERVLGRLMVLRDPHAKVNYTVRELPEVNWNARWESEFQPVEVEGKVRIRAEFHPAKGGFIHDIVITPRMAFGTGHHATTRMMVRSMLHHPVKGQRVCDLGCGTAVLAILAEQMGAAEILAIDHDPLAVENARHNVAINRCKRVIVEKGGTGLGKGAGFGTILANIERNTLINAMGDMVAALAPGGSLLLSGFIMGDAALMDEAATRHGLKKVQDLNDGEWAFSRWEKPAAQAK